MKIKIKMYSCRLFYTAVFEKTTTTTITESNCCMPSLQWVTSWAWVTVTPRIS